ncbi:hypothetical protein L1887_18286 [Cichorium endivia]|nr:hypothetical protein L1887_18286 [Cichorium endivia]
MASKPQGPDATESDSGMGIIDNKMLPPSLVQIERILSVASEIDRVNPRVAFLCRFHAFEKAHKCCRSSRGDAVSQFKAALLQRVKREGKATIEGRRNHDHYEIRAFYRHYCEKYIQGLLNAYNADRTRLTKAYQTAAVLFEVVECVLSNKVPDEILEVHKQVAEKAEIFFHNIRHKVTSLEDKIIQGELEDVILQDQLHFSGCKEGMKQGRLGRLKSKVKFRFCGCSKKQ